MASGLWSIVIAIAALATSLTVRLTATDAASQTGRGGPMSVTTTGGVLHVRAAGFGFIEGDVLNRLRDGRSVRLELILSALGKPGAGPISEIRQVFNLSFDLWEERVAVSRLGTPPRSVSHLRPKDAEAWCLENLPMPLTDLLRRGRETPFWIRIESRVEDAAATNADPEAAFTLRRLIDVFSQRNAGGPLGKSVDGGPFRLSN